MKFGAIYCLYDDHRYLDTSVFPINKFLDKVLFLISDVPWNGKTKDNSDTINKVKDLCSKHNNFELIQGHWTNEIDQRNFGLSCFYKEKIDFAFIIDSDEIYHEHHFKNIIEFIKQNPDYHAFHLEWNTYWKKDYYRIEPRENFKPLVAVKVANFNFTFIRGGITSVMRNELTTFKTQEKEYSGILIPSNIAICYHLSYAGTDEEIKRKIETNSHNPEFIKDWYDRVWLKWKQENKNLHPVTPEQYKIAVKEDFVNFPVQFKTFIKKERLEERTCSIIILNWNSCNLLKQCISLIEKHTKRKYEIVIVDNGSTKDDSVEYIKTLKYKKIFNKENLGFAGGVNSAMREIHNSDVCLLNVDGEPSNNWLERMYETLENNPNCGLVGSKGNEIEPWNRMYNSLDKDTEIAMFPAYCLLIMKEVIEKIGYLDERYKIGGYEDNDYCMRTQLAGYSVMLSHKSYVKHKADHPTFSDNEIDTFKIQKENEVRFNNKIQEILMGYGQIYNFYEKKNIAEHFKLKIK